MLTAMHLFLVILGAYGVIEPCVSGLDASHSFIAPEMCRNTQHPSVCLHFLSLPAQLTKTRNKIKQTEVEIALNEEAHCAFLIQLAQVFE